ncbi:MAG: hypothetical protein ACQEP9_07860 [Bacillota bacterium]
MLFTITVTAAANNNFTEEIEYKVHNINVNSNDGKYIEDVFSKYDSEVYESEFEQCLIGYFNYQLSWGEIKTRLGLLDSDTDADKLSNSMFDLRWEDNLNLRVGTAIKPELSKYIFSNDNDETGCNNEAATAGAIAEFKYNNLQFTPLYLNVEEDIEEFVSDIDIYGIDTNFIAKENLNVGATALKTTPEEKRINDIQAQNNYSLTLDYKPKSG